VWGAAYIGASVPAAAQDFIVSVDRPFVHDDALVQDQTFSVTVKASGMFRLIGASFSLTSTPSSCCW